MTRKFFFTFIIFLVGYWAYRTLSTQPTSDKQQNTPFVERVESISVGDSTQIFLIKENEEIQVSTVPDANHTEPQRQGDFLVWLQHPHNSSESYVVRYHIPTKTLFYVTTKDSSQHPRITTEGKVTWLGWDQRRWNLWYFDGFQTEMIQLEAEPLFVDIFGEFILYSYKDADGNWTAAEYSLQTKKSRVVGTGPGVKHPTYIDGTISYE